MAVKVPVPVTAWVTRRSVTAAGGGIPYSSAPMSRAGPMGRVSPSISSSHRPGATDTPWSMAIVAVEARCRSPSAPSTNKESGWYSRFPVTKALAPSRSRRLWLTKLLIISASVLEKRHSMDEKGACVETTVLCKTCAPHACSRQMPQSKPQSDENSASRSAKTKLLRTMPSKWPT